MRSERCPQRGHGASGATADARIVSPSSSRSRVSTCNERGIGKTAGTTGHLLRRRNPDGAYGPRSSRGPLHQKCGRTDMGYVDGQHHWPTVHGGAPVDVPGVLLGYTSPRHAGSPAYLVMTISGGRRPSRTTPSVVVRDWPSPSVRESRHA